MLNIFKLDMYRILHSKMFYICVFAMNLVAGSMILLNVIPSFAIAMGHGATEMVDTMMGIGMAFMIVAVFFALHICGEFNTGFAKNVFARHSNRLRYIGGKLLALTAAGTIMIVIFTLVSMLLFAVSGAGVALPGGVGGLLVFLIEKMFICAALASIVLLTCVFTRKAAAGILVGVLVAMGVVPMLLTILSTVVATPWIASIANFTISGLSNNASLVFSGATFAMIALGGLAWTAACGILGNRALRVKDI